MTDASLSEMELLAQVFPGESELSERLRALDWASTSLGHPAVWPANLRMALGICLTSKFPMHILWGESLTLFYNDAFSELLGPSKHPAVLGRPGRDAWPEVWPTIGPIIDGVRETKQASSSNDIAIFFERSVPQEEVYATFSFSPLLGPDGVDGLFCVCTESTQNIVKSRRLETLGALGIRAATAQTIDSSCQSAADVLAKNPRDVPFAAIYVIDAVGVAVLRATTGLPAEHPLPRSIATSTADGASWPIALVAKQQRRCVISDLPALGLDVPAGPWPELTRTAVVLPIPSNVPEQPAGVLVLGVSPRRVLDAEYHSFFELVAGHIGTGIADSRAYEQERQRSELLTELDRSKTAFFTNVSHEFRTPLTLILGPLEDALEHMNGGSPEELAGQLETVRRNAFRLLRLVNALLDFSRIEAGRMRASFEPVDIAAETADLASTFRSVVEHAGLSYSIRCDVVDEPVFVDRSMYEMIVLNLLSNAFKFTHEGSIGVVLRSVAQRVEVTVSDTGIGIAPDELPHIFERFRRVEDARARTHEGTGIGLALVRELVHMHGGEVRIESELGRGTSITVVLRKHAGHLPADQIKAKHARSSADAAVAFVEEAARWSPPPPDPNEAFDIARTSTSPRARLLVVDDNADVRNYLLRVLSQHWTVSGAANGQIALDALRKSKFDLVLTDIMMPECDGFQLIRAIRDDPALAALPIIVISGRAGEEARIEGLELGADDYLIKPFVAREIVARVATHLNLLTLRGEALASRAKDEFLAILSHELRNPLAPITTAISLLRMRGSSSHELDVIERQTQQLRHLVDDLLDVARIEAGKVDLVRSPIELSAIVERAVESVRAQVEARRQVLHVHVPSGIVVNADPERISQALANLIANATKYSATESEIDIEAAQMDGVARVIVRDRGVGLAPQMQSRVFQNFVQEAQAIDRKSGGLGLGLAISRGLVELHGGSLRAASEGPGHGAEMIVELPIATAEHAASTEAAPEESGRDSGTQVRRVLVVDDNSDSADLLASALSRFGYSVATAYDGIEGLSTADEFHPDACLLDIGLPSMDGYELARHLRDSQKFPTPPRLIAITGYGQAADRQRAAEAGFDAHLTKPVDLENLLGLLAAGGQLRRAH